MFWSRNVRGKTMSEELQRYQILEGGRPIYRGDKLGSLEHFVLGSTTLAQLKRAGIIRGFTIDIPFKPRIWGGKSSPQSRPDEIILDGSSVIAIVERKDPSELRSQKQEESAAEQCLVYLQQVGGKVGVVTDRRKFIWIHNLGDAHDEIHYVYDEDLSFCKDYSICGTIEDVTKRLHPKTDSIIHEEAVDPSALADKVWQTIWLTTHEEPKHCLATFVELFLYKFLSDLGLLPENLSFEKLNCDEEIFRRREGRTQIEFYVQIVRPKMKGLFPEDKFVVFPLDSFVIGSDTTSIIDGFVFLEPGIANHNHPLETFNHSFLAIIKAFVEFGKIRKIDTEFKSRVYEKFLKKNIKQQKLGQYLTPRNIVRAIVHMANIGQLKRLSGKKSICDPACGVGGFLLEPLLYDSLLKDNYEEIDGELRPRIELVGLEIDRQTNILAKANMLIHMAENYIGYSSKARKYYSKVVNQTFLLVDHDKMLGALEFPQEERFDLILTNPPFVVRGTKVIKDKILRRDDLRKRYDRAGTGTESLFIRWIVDALKPGGRAFVIVPTGVLTRSELAVRAYVEKYCILDGIVSLPQRTFYHNLNPTYILILTKRVSTTDRQPSQVFAYLIREVGETRDALRLKCHSDLPDLIRQFRVFYADKEIFEPRNPNCKLIPIEKLRPEDRWDIDRFWSDDEKRQLGILKVQTAITLYEFESAVDSMVTSIKEEIEELELDGVEYESMSITLGNEEYFKLIRGRRVTRKQIYDNPGNIPVISGHKKADSYLGRISEDWLINQGIPVYNRPLVTVNSNGNVGRVFLRELSKYTFHDDVTAVDVKDKNIYPPFLVYAIRLAIAKAHFKYDAKLYMKRLKTLSVEIPVDRNGKFDLDRQKIEATKYEKLLEIKRTPKEFVRKIEDKFLTVE